jgi:RNA polymerase-binding transcription factor DksA
MNTKDLSLLRKNLLEMRARIRTDVFNMSGAVLGDAGFDRNSGISAQYTIFADGVASVDSMFWLIESETQTLDSIERALERIEEHQYGLCEYCGKGIAISRLRAIPYTTTCTQCTGRAAIH